jgi:hypothetical protein
VRSRRIWTATTASIPCFNTALFVAPHTTQNQLIIASGAYPTTFILWDLLPDWPRQRLRPHPHGDMPRATRGEQSGSVIESIYRTVAHSNTACGTPTCPTVNLMLTPLGVTAPDERTSLR